MRWVVIVALLVGCYAPASTRCQPCSGIEECPGGLACLQGMCRNDVDQCTGGDGDAAIDAPDAPSGCFGVQDPPFFVVCPVEPVPVVPDPPLKSPINTDSSCSFSVVSDGRTFCVIQADRITVTQATRVIGSVPLVLLARQELVIDSGALLDLRGSHTDTDSTPLAAASNDARCITMPGVSAGQDLGGGGAPGGTLRTIGGEGGKSASVLKTSAAAVDPNAGLELRGGCPGGKGGGGGTTPAEGGGRGGNSGGAIYLLAPVIRIAGTINASGGGARSARIQTGGGGGGSGGMILLWSSSAITIGAGGKVFALGGGGGPGGGSPSSAADGPDGADPISPTQPAATTLGPLGSGMGGGGSGFVTDDGGAGVGTAGAGGGGGGGGGMGHIKVRPSFLSTGGSIAPPPN